MSAYKLLYMKKQDTGSRTVGKITEGKTYRTPHGDFLVTKINRVNAKATRVYDGALYNVPISMLERSEIVEDD